MIFFSCDIKMLLKEILLCVMCIQLFALSQTVEYAGRCICAVVGTVPIHKQADARSDVIATIDNQQCYRLIAEQVSQRNTSWYAVNLITETGYIAGHGTEIRNCNITDSGKGNRNDNWSTNIKMLQNRASTIGDTTLCGQNLQLWASRSSDRILAQRQKSCYGIQLGSKQTYQYAFSYCQSSVSYLVDILDDQEQAFVELLVNRYLSGEKIWIGLHDLQKERFFDWTSGKPISYVNWYSTSQAFSSVNHDIQDCVTLVPFHGGKWEVENCYTGNDATEPKHLFICEFEIKTPAQVVG